MIDPIINILEGFESESKFTGNEAYDDLLSESVKQIRQQIGRELLQCEHVMTERGINNVYNIFYVTSNRINEVCQLEEE